MGDVNMDLPQINSLPCISQRDVFTFLSVIPVFKDTAEITLCMPSKHKVLHSELSQEAAICLLLAEKPGGTDLLVDGPEYSFFQRVPVSNFA